eukprot:4424332-Amphidinium_carterae.1
MVGITAAKSPKTRRKKAHARLQHVILDDEGFVQWVEHVWSVVFAYSVHMWDRKPEEFWTMWHRSGRCGIEAFWPSEFHTGPGNKSSGLTGGGATEHYLHYRDLQGLRRRGRWTQLTTIDRY